MFIYNSLYNTFENNVFRDSNIAIHLTAGSKENEVFDNAFVNNQRQVKYVATRTQEWSKEGRGNYWSDYLGWDRNQDGIGDVAYEPNDNVDRLLWTYPEAKVLMFSPAVDTLRWVQEAFPVVKAAESDSESFMRMVSFKVLSAAVMFAVFLTGCSESVEKVTEKPEPVHIESGDECHVCGMVITRFPGPKGEAITAREQTVHKFCSTRDMFSWALQPENAKRDHTLYVHDMAQTDWEHPDDTALIDARDAFFVIGSERKGAMGPTLASFASENSAVEFANEYGGEVVRFKDVTMHHVARDMSQNVSDPTMEMGSHDGKL